jgi:hypothetical protein
MVNEMKGFERVDFKLEDVKITTLIKLTEEELLEFLAKEYSKRMGISTVIVKPEYKILEWIPGDINITIQITGYAEIGN